jgi:hypothetical protein
MVVNVLLFLVKGGSQIEEEHFIDLVFQLMFQGGHIYNVINQSFDIGHVLCTSICGVNSCDIYWVIECNIFGFIECEDKKSGLHNNTLDKGNLVTQGKGRSYAALSQKSSFLFPTKIDINFYYSSRNDDRIITCNLGFLL